MIEVDFHPLEQYEPGHSATLEGHLLTYLSNTRFDDSHVEISFLDPSLAHDLEAVDRFRQITGRASGLQHPSILSVVEQGTSHGQPYFVSPYISGGTLAHFLKLSGPLPLDQVVQWVAQLGDAIDYAHEQGIIFPGFGAHNIRRSDDGRVIVADFGLLEWWYELDGLDQGAMPYAAPELLLRMPYTASIDIYALGVLAYQMLAGQLPFGGATQTQWLQAHWRQSLPPIQTLRADLPAATQEVLRRTTSKLGANRYAIAREMVEDLCASLDVSVPGSFAPEWHVRGIHPGKPVLYKYHKAKPSGSHTRNISMGRLYAEALVQEQINPSEAIAIYREIATNWPQFAQSDVIDRLERLERQRGLTRLPNLISRARQALSLGDWHQLEKLAVEILSYNPDYYEAEQMQSLARSQSAADEHYQSAEQAVEVNHHASAVMLLRELYSALPHYKDSAGLLVISPANASFLRERASLRAHRAQILALCCSPGGGEVASGSTDKTVRMWQGPDLSQHYVVPGSQSWVCSLVYSPDGSALLSGSWDGDVRILAAFDGKYEGIIAGHTSQVRAMAFARHDPTLLAVASGSFLTFWRMPDGTRETVVKEVGHAIWSLTFSPVAPYLICGLTSGVLRIRDTSAPGCPVLVDTPIYTQPIYAVDSSPDGTWVASASRDGQARITHVMSGKLLHELRGHEDSILDIRFSRDGSLVATAGVDQTIRVWNAQTGGLVTALRGHRAPITRVCFSADGRWLASADVNGVIKTWSIA
jgi:serine/threonine protein kinase